MGKLLGIFGRVALVLGLGLVTLIGAVLVDHFFSTDLPTPGGAFPVGRTTLRFLAPGDGGQTPPHEVFAWVWFPAATDAGKPAEYLPDPWRVAMERWVGPIRYLVERDLRQVRTHSRTGGEIRPATTPYGVVLFRGGMSTLAAEYTSLAEDWASRGYIVVGIDAPTRSLVYVAQNGDVTTRSRDNDAEAADPIEALHNLLPRLVSVWAGDASAVLDRLDLLNNDAANQFWFGHVAVTRTAMAGHSLGGAVALQFCRKDERCVAAIDIDGLVSPEVARMGVRVPSMFLMGAHPATEQEDPGNRLIVSGIDGAISHSTPGLVTRAVFPAANHFNFSDGAVTKNHVLMTVLRIVGLVRMNPREQIIETASQCAEFLARNLGVPHDSSHPPIATSAPP